MISLKEFYIMWADEVCTHVVIDNTYAPVLVERYVKEIPKQPLFSENITREQLYTFITSRCFEEGNAGKDFLLKEFGLKEYNPWEIIRITHGFLLSDMCWIRFSGEKITWRELNETIRNKQRFPNLG